MQKTVLSAQGLLEDSFRLGAQVLKDGFKPTLLIAIWRGGTPVGMALQELLSYCGVNADHIAIRTSSYHGVDERSSHVAIHGLDYIVNKINTHDRVLIVDDVFDTGNTIAAVIKELRRRSRDNMSNDVRIAVPWFKPTRNMTDLTPDYFVHETDEWLVFPHELDALTPDELAEHRPRLATVVAGIAARKSH
ncbi:MAG: phosphoribosyltransferase family protein [Pseudomonadota bacterium]